MQCLSHLLLFFHADAERAKSLATLSCYAQFSGPLAIFSTLCDYCKSETVFSNVLTISEDIVDSEGEIETCLVFRNLEISIRVCIIASLLLSF